MIRLDSVPTLRGVGAGDEPTKLAPHLYVQPGDRLIACPTKWGCQVPAMLDCPCSWPKMEEQSERTDERNYQDSRCQCAERAVPGPILSKHLPQLPPGIPLVLRL